LFLAGAVNAYTITPLHPVRKLIIDQMDFAMKRHNIHATFDVDITLINTKLKELRRERKVYSFTAYLIFCLAQVLENNKSILAMRWKRYQSVCFDEVDINTIIEKRINKETSIPISLIIRDAGKKSLMDINSELREAQKKNPLDIEGVKERRRLIAYPGFIRRFLLKQIHSNPFKQKKYYGTAAVTSLNFLSGNKVWHGIPLVACPLCLLPAGTFKRVVMENGVPVEKDFCSFTFTINHDIIDGSPATRFAAQFVEKLENAYGL